VSQPNQTGDRLKVALCTREYPREVYGGAGVHVEYPAEELSEHVDLTVHRVGRKAVCRSVDSPRPTRDHAGPVGRCFSSAP
jgi:starch synthase